MPIKSRRVVVPVTLERAGEEVEAEIVCDFLPPVAGEPAEVSIEEVRRADREPTSARDLTDQEVERVERIVFDAVENG